ncbi:MAG: hypothetical protein H6746_13510 [Deltaproteobacteria bacterium]|nr:hypothetical protein [Deltaproteobacteria bacterium]
MRNMLKRLILMTALPVICVAPAALAADPPAAEPAATAEPQVFDFEGDDVTTDYLKPNRLLVEGLRRGRMSSLITVRLDFVDEIVRSAEDI